MATPAPSTTSSEHLIDNIDKTDGSSQLTSSSPPLPSKDILGSVIEICIVTPSLRSTISSLRRLGIGPFKVYHFNSATVIDQEFRGQRGKDLFEIMVGFADFASGGVVLEVMQPIVRPHAEGEEESLMEEWLAERKLQGSFGGDDSHVGEGRLEALSALSGVQHVAFSMHDLPMAERQAIMKAHGFEVAMQGVWLGKNGSRCHFCFFDTEEKGCGTVVETIEFSPGWEDPDPVEVL